MWKRTILGLSVMILALVALACDTVEVKPPPQVDPGYITAVFEECREQESLGDATSCWKLFMERFKDSASAAEQEYAQMKVSKPAVVEPTCSPGTSWNGSQCVSLCKEASLEIWDNGESACIRKMELECNEYFHQEDGHCVADPHCPDGMRKVAAGGCERIPETDRLGLKPGMRVVSLVEQSGVGGKVMVKRGAKGTFWFYDPSDRTVFVIWDAYVGASPTYPPPSTGTPQGKSSNAYWVMADEIAPDTTSVDDPSLIPQWCGQRAGQLSFGRVKVGTMVKLGKHRAVDGSTNWDDDMAQYVDKITRVTELKTTADLAGCPIVKVSVDGGKYVWRIRDMTLAPVSRPETKPVPATKPGPSGPPT